MRRETHSPEVAGVDVRLGIHVKEMATKVQIGQPNRPQVVNRFTIPVDMPAKCCRCLGNADSKTTLGREEGVAGGVATVLTGAAYAGLPVRQRFFELDVPLCKACEAAYRRRGAVTAAIVILPVLVFLVGLLAVQSATYALLCLGWLAGPMAAFGVANKLGAFKPGRLGRGGRPRFHNRTYQCEYDAANPEARS